MSLHWFLIIFAIGFAGSLSGISRADFFPRTTLGRILAIFLILFVVGVIVAFVWVLLPFALDR